jgi:NAD(P)-dependent dehydrogenase (short-subunit alcohol dehydrogenase family)
MNLVNQCAIVTGSTKGIGLAIAQALHREGAHVVISARTEQDIAHTVESLSGSGGARVAGMRCDVRNEADIKALIDFVVSEFGGLDILVNNAGIGVFRRVEEMTSHDWHLVINTNLDSLFYGCHHAIPAMKKRGGGFIVNIGSLAGKNAFVTGAAYNASKFGLIGFSEALMQELRYDGIRVAYVMPGSVDTWFGGTPPDGGDSWKVGADDVAQVVTETLKRDPRCLTSRIEIRPSKPPRK